jgi:hypothetical protein
LSAVRRLGILALAAFLAACGSTAEKEASSPAQGPGPGAVIFQGSEWAVVVDHGEAHAQHLVAGRWTSDTSNAVRVTVLGPKPGSKQPATPQVAAELVGDAPLAESGLWVDGVEVLEKGGGLTPKRGTIYGAPASPLAPGDHTAVAYARTATHGTAVAWTFHV